MLIVHVDGLDDLHWAIGCWRLARPQATYPRRMSPEPHQTQAAAAAAAATLVAATASQQRRSVRSHGSLACSVPPGQKQRLAATNCGQSMRAAWRERSPWSSL
jgi:hypothetical protein